MIGETFGPVLGAGAGGGGGGSLTSAFTEVTSSASLPGGFSEAMDSPSLAVGTWLVNITATIEYDPAATATEPIIGVIEQKSGTVATHGPYAFIFPNPDGTAGAHTVTSTLIAVVTATAVLKLTTDNPGPTATLVGNNPTFTEPTSGFTAIKIA